MEKVSFLACDNYEIDRLTEIVERHFEMLDPDNKLIKKGDTVAIKPNLIISRGPEEATTTHPEFVAAIIRAVKKRGGSPVIAESPGGPHNRMNLKNVYTRCGIEAMAEREGALLNYDLAIGTLESKNAKVCHSFDAIEPIIKADVVITAAKLKTHAMMTYSGAVKNLFGVIPGLLKPEFHYRYPNKDDFANMIVDVCEGVAPAIAFIDGIDAMEGNGPTGGQKRHLGATFAGLNPHALDLFASGVAGFKIDEVPTLKAAIARGLCPAGVDSLTLLGDSAESFYTEFLKPESKDIELLKFMPAFLQGPLKNLITPRPVVVKSTCIGCGKCAESCPQKTIRITNRKAYIIRKDCIRCYCCHEMCPVKSIDIKKSLIGRL